MSIKGPSAFIRDAVHSVRTQTFTDWELVICKDIVDEASESFLRLASLKDPRIRIVNTVGLSHPSALNKGIAECRGELIARFDSDDIMLPTRLKSQVSFLNSHPDYVACGGQVVIIDHENRLKFASPYYNIKDSTIKRKLTMKCPFANPATMIRASALRGIGGYSLFFQYAEDYELWLRLANLGKFANLSKPVIAYRSHITQTSVKFEAETRFGMAIAALRRFSGNDQIEHSIDGPIDSNLLESEFALADASQRELITRLYKKDSFIRGIGGFERLKNGPDRRSTFLFDFLLALPRRATHLTLKFLFSLHSYLTIRPSWNKYQYKLTLANNYSVKLLHLDNQ